VYCSESTQQHRQRGESARCQGTIISDSRRDCRSAIGPPSAIMHVIWSNQRATWGLQRIMEAHSASHTAIDSTGLGMRAEGRSAGERACCCLEHVSSYGTCCCMLALIGSRGAAIVAPSHVTGPPRGSPSAAIRQSSLATRYTEQVSSILILSIVIYSAV
jgi:hypothetical protein